MTIVRPAQLSDIPACWNHNNRLVKESGQQGDFIFSPIENTLEATLEEFERDCNKRWEKPIHEIGWERCWIITDTNGVYGCLNLVHRPWVKTCLHRATLMMGIERSHRKQGYGAQLMTHAIEWAKNQPSLEWLQLFVFEGNTPAKNLYRKFGFTENGTTPDMFRIFGKQIDDTSMIFKLR